MHVLFYTPHWKTGGIERIIKYIADGLNSDRYRFSIITEDYPRPSGQFQIEGASIYFREFSPFNSDNALRFRELVNRIQPDIAVAMGSSRALYKPSRALLGSEIPIIMSEHNPPERLVGRFNGDFRFLNAVRDLADFNHVLFERYAQGYHQPNKVRVIGNPVPSAVSVADPYAARKNWIVNISRYDLEQKQQDVLIKSFAKISSQYPAWNLALYGENWNGGREKVTALSRALGLEDRVAVNGATTDVEGALLSGKIFAFPSAYEGFPLAAGEALSHGLPIVGFRDCPGLNQLVSAGYNGLLAGPGVRNVSSLAETLARLMGDERLRVEMAENAEQSVKKYRLDSFLSAWSSLFDEAFDRRGKNILFLNSAIELEYFNLLSSGRLFDELKESGARSRRRKRRHNSGFKRRIKCIVKAFRKTRLFDRVPQ